MRRQPPVRPPRIYALGQGMDEYNLHWPKPIVPEYRSVIYGLRAAGESRFHYVGSTFVPGQRLTNHWAKRFWPSDEKAQWLAQLMDRGEQPVLVVLEMTTRAKRQELERRWIRFLRETGHPLTNRRDW